VTIFQFYLSLRRKLLKQSETVLPHQELGTCFLLDLLEDYIRLTWRFTNIYKYKVKYFVDKRYFDEEPALDLNHVQKEWDIAHAAYFT
jgi:hypothetical protein